MTDEEIEEIRANNEKDKKDNPEMFGLEPEQQNIPPEGSSNDSNN
jgi:hypothetical protein